MRWVRLHLSYSSSSTVSKMRWRVCRNKNSRDVTKFEFEFRTFSTDSKFVMCFKCLLSNANSWNNPCSTTDFVCTARSRLLPENANKLVFFLKFNLTLLNYSYWMNTTLLLFSEVLHYWFEHLFYWHYQTTYCQNHLIDINQCTEFRLIKILIRIRRMQILTSFVTSMK